jgi:formylglycine-generating enzyme required for sulfatase activity
LTNSKAAAAALTWTLLAGCNVLFPQDDPEDDTSPDAGASADQGGDADDFEAPIPVMERVRSIDQMPQVLVLGGTFTMGREDGPAAESPPRSVTISADFFMDRHEVTVGQWQACVDTGSCTGDHAGSADLEGTCNWRSTFGDDQPMNCVGSPGAEAYCAWVGGSLPSEAQWEYAAAGPDSLPWVSGEQEPSCAQAVWSNPGECDLLGTQAVESLVRDTSFWGARDLGGNVQEWVTDFYDTAAYSTLPATDPVNTTPGNHRVQRGGAFSDRSPDNLRTTTRRRSFPDVRVAEGGFRCVGGE